MYTRNARITKAAAINIDPKNPRSNKNSKNSTKHGTEHKKMVRLATFSSGEKLP